MQQFEQEISACLEYQFGVRPEQASAGQLYHAVSAAAMRSLAGRWNPAPPGKRACYFSMEFLTGRLINSNLLNLGRLEACGAYLRAHGLDISVFEQIEDDALGSGGLGRLAACLLDSAATHSIPLDGYGIRYRYGLFRQRIEGGFQKEEADDWLRFGDPWSIRREEEAASVRFGGQTVRAIPYDMPVIGYGGAAVNTLRLWQAEPVVQFDFERFHRQDYDGAVEERVRAEEISATLYPNDDAPAGKRLRLKQEYFLVSASLQGLVRSYLLRHGEDFTRFAQAFAIQLNDTHPAVAIPELLRILVSDHQVPSAQAFETVRAVFAYTNHTVLPEALERWDIGLFRETLPDVYPYLVMTDDLLKCEMKAKGLAGEAVRPYRILEDGQAHMARLAVYGSHAVNGVSKIHTGLLKTQLLADWYRLYPERFSNKTNGVTQRRWLALCNPELSELLCTRIGEGWITDLSQLKKLEPQLSDPALLEAFLQVKRRKKEQLCACVRERENGFVLNPEFVFDLQIKRMHEYKRQLLNAFSILDIYFGLKEGSIQYFTPTAFLFGAKAAPGYRRAKAVIKFIHEIARRINADPEMHDRMQVLFVQNYDVSYAEKLIPAADLSEQISTAGTEASGTGNMKLMLNGAATIGTPDGANIEIVEQAGEENNYLFGATVEELAQISQSYNPRALCLRDPRIKRLVDTLIDGSVSDGGTGYFGELYDSLMKKGADWKRPDEYYLLHDLLPYTEARLRANRDCADRMGFAEKCLRNIANAGQFSSDRTVREYAGEIWNV